MATLGAPSTWVSFMENSALFVLLRVPNQAIACKLCPMSHNKVKKRRVPCPLSDEITKRRQEIFSDGYSMSVGELISMYEHDELDLHPQFQRFFRWTEVQRSRLIESLLLGIPVPSIFVSQRADGVWDVIDGLQRLSTILQLVGILKDETGDLRDPLQLTATDYLPSLKGKTWNGDADSGIGRDHQLLIKRSKIDVKIILRESSDASKYELFQRLNMGGSQLSDQEIRNVMIIMVDPSFYDWINELSKDEHFQSCIALSDRLLSEQYDLELVVRFLTLRRIKDSDFRRIDDLGSFLDTEILRLAEDKTFDRDREETIFRATLKVLSEMQGSEIFRRFDTYKGRHLGGFLISAFEVFAIGMSQHVRDGTQQIDCDRLTQLVKYIWSDDTFTTNIGTGTRASSRIQKVIPYARRELTKCLSATKAN